MLSFFSVSCFPTAMRRVTHSDTVDIIELYHFLTQFYRIRTLEVKGLLTFSQLVISVVHCHPELPDVGIEN